MNNFGLGLVLNFTDRATSGINLAVGSFQRLNTMAERVGKTTDTTRQSFEEMVIAGLSITSIGYVAETTGDMVVNAFEKIIESTIEVGSYFEQTRITLSTLFQSDAIAEDKIDWLLDFAKTTPFDVENLTSAFVSMKAMGVDASTELQMASGATQSLMGYLGDLNAYRPDLDMSYIIRGVRNAMGGNTRSLDMILDIDSEGMIGKTFDNIETDLPALVQALGVEGMMAKLEGTWQQKLTNMGDAWTILALRISDAGLFAGAKEILGIVADYLGSLTSDENEERLFAIAQVLSDAFTSILEPLKGVAEWLVNLTDKFIDFAIANPELVQGILKVVAVFGALMLGIGTVFQILGPAITAFSTFGLFLSTAGTTASKTAGSIGLLSGGFAKFLPVIGWVIGAFYLLKEAYDNNFMGFKTFVDYLREKAQPFFEGLGLLIQGVFGTLNDEQLRTADEMGLTNIIEGFKEMNSALWDFWETNNEWIIDGAIFVSLATGIGKVYEAVKLIAGLKGVQWVAELFASIGTLGAMAVGTVGVILVGTMYLTADEAATSRWDSLIREYDGKQYETEIKQYDELPATTKIGNWFKGLFGIEAKTLEELNKEWYDMASGRLDTEIFGEPERSLDTYRELVKYFDELGEGYEALTAVFLASENAQQGVADGIVALKDGWGNFVDFLKETWNDIAEVINESFGTNLSTFIIDKPEVSLAYANNTDFNEPFTGLLGGGTKDSYIKNQQMLKDNSYNNSIFSNFASEMNRINYEIVAGMESNRSEVENQAFQTIQSVTDKYAPLPDKSWEVGGDSTSNLALSIDSNRYKTENSSRTMYDNILTILRPLIEEGEPIGISVIEGLVRGMEAVSVISPTRGLVELVITAFKKGFDLNSPSRETQWIGENLIYGLIKGMSIGDLASFANSLTNTLVTAFTNGMLTATEILSVLGEKAKSKLKELGIVFGSTYGDLVLPNAPITSDFGWRDPFLTDSGEWSSSYHEGVDYGLPWGYPVGSAGDGVVDYAGWYGGYGNSVIVDHGDGLSSLYAHLSSILVTIGQIVEAGDILGLVGSTGNSTGAHLHFGLYQDGVAIDPLQGFAKGVNSFVGGLALINEQGGEIVNLPNGSQVIPNDKTVELSKTQGRLEAYERLVKQGGNKQVISQDDNSLVFEKESVVIHVHGTTDRDLDDVAETLMKKIDRLRYLKSIGSRNSLFKKV